MRVCVPVCVRRADELKAAVARAAAHADIVELRLDCLEASELERARPLLAELFDAPPRPFLVTFRPAEQGGRRALDTRQRLSFWLDHSWPVAGERDRAELFDIELDLLSANDENAPTEGRAATKAEDETRAAFGEWLKLNGPRVVCSHHDFGGVPANLEQLYERAARTPARVLKFAVRADDATDCLPVLRLLERARREGRELIAVSMGEAGTWTRVLGPSRGAFLTYGALDDAQRTAPGQLAAADLRELYRIDTLDAETSIVGLVGSPVAHSLSPHVHNAAFAALDLNAVYLTFETRDAAEYVRRMARPATRELDWRLRGLSVTAPHKSAVMRALDWVEPSAREIGAVNTVVVEGDELRGYNTDAAAALTPLDGLTDLKGARVAVLGAGGAARAVLWALRERGAHAVVFARDAARARETARAFGADSRPLAGARFADFDTVVNATPLGTRGHAEHETPADRQQLRGARIVYDLVYNPAETRLLREARAAGCRTAGGLPMLVAQAAAQFKLWTGRDAPLEVMRAAAERQMLDVGG